MNDITPNYLDDDKPYYEYHRELDGLREQNDQLREMVRQLRAEIGNYRNQAEAAMLQMQQMEDARAGVTGARHFFQRSDGAENVAQWHYTIDGARSVCRTKIDPQKYTLVELSQAPDGLCNKCNDSLEAEIRYNHYRESERDGNAPWGRQQTLEKQNAQIFRAKHAPTDKYTTYVYLIQTEGQNHFKVGISTTPEKRLADLRHAGGRKLKVLLLSEPCTPDGARRVERKVRDEFDNRRVAQEWYSFSWQQVKRVKEIITLTVALDRNTNLRIVR